MCRNKEIRVRFSKDELERIEKKANELSMKPSTFVRMIALKANMKIEANKADFH